MTGTDQQLTINTPEQVFLQFEVAGIGSRFMAFFIDTLVQLIAFAICTITLAIIGISVGRWGTSKWAIALLILAGFAVYWGYFAVFEALWKGQTPGKRVVGIRVVKDSGRAMKPAEAVTRNLLRLIDQMPGMYVFGLISILVSKEKKRIGDFVAGTVVVHEKAAQEIHPDLQQLDDGMPVMAWALQLTNGDLEIIESFLHRRISLDQDVRKVTAIRIVEHVKSKTGETPAPRESDEDFLQRVAVAIRNSRRN